MADKDVRGRAGEERAARYLTENGFTVLDRNWRCRAGELDIVAMRRTQTVDAGVALSGTAQAPRVRLVSNPELSDAEKLSWLVLGRGPDGLGSSDDNRPGH